MSDETQSKCTCVTKNSYAEEYRNQFLIVKVDHHGNDSDNCYGVAYCEAFDGAKIVINRNTEGICYNLSGVTD